MAVATAPEIIAPLTDAGKGAFHQRVSAPIYGGGSPSAPPVPVGAVLAGGLTGVAYSETITAQGGTSPWTYAVTSGALPAGLSLASSGVISGTPTATGTATFTVTVTDAASATGSHAFSITIAAPSSGGGGNYGFTA